MIEIASSTSTPLTGNGDTLAKNLIARLEQHYPAFTGAWRVFVNEQGGVIQVTNMMLSGKMGFLMHISKIDLEGRAVVRAGGELLERYRVSRDKAYKIQTFIDMPRNRMGNLTHD